MSKNIPKIAISIGDLNGIGLEIALNSHNEIKKICSPIYCINKNLLEKASKLLKIKIPKDFSIFETKGYFEITPSKVSKNAGLYSFHSFIDAINLAKKKEVDAICTLPINKESWNKAKISYKGHTEVLRDIFKKDAIMMLGCSKMYVALFTEHIALKDIVKNISTKKLTKFFLDFHSCTNASKVAVLALNPHAGDGGVLGNDEKKIVKAIKKANSILEKDIFSNPLVPDTAFSPNSRKNYKYFIAMYHDQGLIPLKALYFDESINVSLNLPIIRTSVDHGTAFDIAYKNKQPNKTSYINAVKEAISLSKNR
ncbi:4-hydroxythreonine-4-phosphate dehydrogenase [Aliarcobacter thereius]|uniref:4-hydroxythreonine-4-phosphate dehydrogenase n=1 Tax=Aliarcobacter thereius LMG 24486 TaxID=1032240 RepID=A0A1C7WS43_9BACT|nr:4-hydroxythreonine-4-phosphate dehydrogenase [Aliarcobacter thereius]OCL85791.1 4-hydroxythreonine-4-phosphate dehydrogenase [Aliarcobacter thereius]OCL89778.1 4-hydroxythreonine-4-phosphate dehydrogenase [Aliarcobacter thereius]OCL96428.1 4-hydroxythreonine-4-phosphate dehydrogenase [Aliarcobacter thereius LMG 24486]QBF15610.1 4-hydroxy-L-threonine phosphate dehydrogenase, NAD-dependent [Aliarcobacter thereius LMG 24486]TLS91706.1 4-hydroxythreonine-4-phosphate dehydrogenase [Aliarcobacter